MSLRNQFVDVDQPAPKPVIRRPVTESLRAQIAAPVTQTIPVTVLPVTKAIPVTKKKPGRPKSDHAMTPAERQRRRRDRLALAKAGA
jgi:hypothetical protein